MSDSSFYEERAKEQTRSVVRDIESHTSAEIVVALRRVAGHYRDTDYLVGFLLALATLLVLLFADFSFRLGTFPVAVSLSFIAGALFSSQITPLRRLLTLPSRKRALARHAARAAFVELGVHHTRGRTGILVFVALFEREVIVISDAGVDPALLGADWQEALETLRTSLRPRPAFEHFLTALRALQAPLALALPRAADDANELPDEMVGE